MSLHSSSERFSRAEVSQAVSRQLHLPPELDAIANLSGKLHYFVNQMQSFRTASLDGADFKSLVMNNITPELMQMLDPAKQNAAKREQAERANAFSADAPAWAGRGPGQWINGQWVSAAAAGRGDAGSSGGGRANYQAISYANAQSLQGVTTAGYARTPFAAAGVHFGTFDYLRKFDRNFTGQNILNAANDAKALGFGANDRAAMRDHAIIDHYDPAARKTNDHLRGYRTGLIESEEHRAAAQELGRAKTEDERKAALAKLKNIEQEQREKHGIKADISDSKKPAKVRAGIGRRSDAIDQQVRKLHGATPDNKLRNSNEQAKPTGAETEQRKAIFEALKKRKAGAAPSPEAK
jgi:hypothetical protein